MSNRELLEASLARMEGGRRWIQGDLHDSKGNVCAWGAVDQTYPLLGLSVFESDAALSVLADVINEQYPDRVGFFMPQSEHTVSTFNDHEDTVWEDVERVFEKAIANA